MQSAELPEWPVCGERFNARYSVTDADWYREDDRLYYPNTLPLPDQIFADREALEAKKPAAEPIVSAEEQASLEAGTTLPSTLAQIVGRLTKNATHFPAS